METPETITIQLPSFITRLRRRGREGWQRLGRRLLPTPGNVLFTLLMIGLLLWAQSAGALPLRLLGPNVPSTNTIAYQGRLADAGGSPLTGAYSIIFRLYNAASGGAPLWEEQWTGQNGVQVSDGLFNVMLGSLTPIPQAVVTGNNTLWLGITVGTDDEMAPRVQLGSVPFAVQALTVPDGSVTTGKIADGAVTQAKLGPDVNLVPPDGSITTAKLADGAVTSPKLNLQNGSACLGSDTTVSVPGGWTRVQIPGMSVQVTLSASERLLIWFGTKYYVTPAGSYYYGTTIFLDGTEMLDLPELPPSTAWRTGGTIRTVTLSAGAHTFDLRTYGQNTGSVYYAGGSQNTCLQYLVIS